MVEEAIEGVVMRVPEHHASAGASGLAVKSPFLLFASFQLATRCLLTLHLVVNIETAASLGAEV